jgi:hypothetical protein
VITEHLGYRRKSPVWSTEAIYLLGSTAGVPEKRSAALICAGAPVPSLNRHKIWPDCENGLRLEEGKRGRSGYTQCQQWAAIPLPNPVLGAAATAYAEPRTRAASAPGRQPPVRRRGRGASPGAGRGRGHRPRRTPATEPEPEPSGAQEPSWAPRTTPGPTQLLTGPRGRPSANIAASGPRLYLYIYTKPQAAGAPWS